MPTARDGRPRPFGLVVVPGVTVDKWARVWSQRLPAVPLQVIPASLDEAATLLATSADAGLIRLPVDAALHAIPLYTETTVVVVPTDHPVTAADQVTIADLAGEPMLRPLDDALAWSDANDASATVAVDTTAAAVELVAAGAGLLVVPQSLARAHHRRDLAYRVVTDAPTSSVALAWRREEPPELIEEMIGIVRGRTVNSTRGQAQPRTSPRQRGR